MYPRWNTEVNSEHDGTQPNSPNEWQKEKSLSKCNTYSLSDLRYEDLICSQAMPTRPIITKKSTTIIIIIRVNNYVHRTKWFTKISNINSTQLQFNIVRWQSCSKNQNYSLVIKIVKLSKELNPLGFRGSHQKVCTWVLLWECILGYHNDTSFR